jgi:hypothetical protein
MKCTCTGQFAAMSEFTAVPTWTVYTINVITLIKDLCLAMQWRHFGGWGTVVQCHYFLTRLLNRGKEWASQSGRFVPVKALQFPFSRRLYRQMRLKYVNKTDAEMFRLVQVFFMHSSLNFTRLPEDTESLMWLPRNVMTHWKHPRQRVLWSYFHWLAAL